MGRVLQRFLLAGLLVVELGLFLVVVAPFSSNSLLLEKKRLAYQQSPNGATKAVWKAEADRLRNRDSIVFAVEWLLLIGNGFVIIFLYRSTLEGVEVTSSNDASPPRPPNS